MGRQTPPLATQNPTKKHTHAHTHPPTESFPCKHNIDGKLIKISSIGKRWGTKLLIRVTIGNYKKKRR
jgi:hypothetical protein